MQTDTQQEPSAQIGDALRQRLAGFVRTLRDNGFAVGLAETRDALKMLASPAMARPEPLRPALNALFCATRTDWEKFDEIFDAYWQGRGMKRMRAAAAATTSAQAAVRMPTIVAPWRSACPETPQAGGAPAG